MKLGKHDQERLSAGFSYALLIVGATIVLFPLLWMVSTALKDPGLVFRYPPQWFPDPIMWSNFKRGWFLLAPTFGSFFLNTAKIAGLAGIGAVLSASIVAYSFARLRWTGRDFIFLLVLGSMMLPSQVTLVPHFVIYRWLGWYDTHFPLWVPYWFAGSFFVFLLRQYMMTIPHELDDAALIDGCSHFSIFWRIVLPLSKAPIATVAIFSIQWTWNDFFAPLIYLSDQYKWTVALGLRALQSSIMVDWTALMSMASLSLIPVMLIFVFAQRLFIQGIVFTGIKG